MQIKSVAVDFDGTLRFDAQWPSVLGVPNYRLIDF